MNFGHFLISGKNGGGGQKTCSRKMPITVLSSWKRFNNSLKSWQLFEKDDNSLKKLTTLWKSGRNIQDPTPQKWKKHASVLGVLIISVLLFKITVWNSWKRFDNSLKKKQCFEKVDNSLKNSLKKLLILFYYGLTIVKKDLQKPLD